MSVTNPTRGVELVITRSTYASLGMESIHTGETTGLALLIFIFVSNFGVYSFTTEYSQGTFCTEMTALLFAFTLFSTSAACHCEIWYFHLPAQPVWIWLVVRSHWPCQLAYLLITNAEMQILQERDILYVTKLCTGSALCFGLVW